MKDFSIYSLSGLIDKGVAFLFICILSNHLDKSEMGYIGLFLSISACMQIFIGMGSDTYARLRVVKNFECFESTFSSIIKILCVTILVSYILMKIWLYIGPNISISEKHFTVAFIYALFSHLFLLHQSIAQGLRKLKAYFLVNAIKSSVELVLFFVLIRELNSILDSRINALVFTAMLIGNVSLILLLRKHNFNFGDNNETKSVFRFMLRSLPNTLLIGGVFVIDRIIIGQNSMILIGEIVFLFGICSPLLFLVEILNKSIIPHCFKLLKNNSMDDYNIYNLRIIIVYLLIGTSYCCLLQLLSEHFINEKYIYIVKYSFLFLLFPLFKLLYYCFARVFTFNETVHKLFYINFPISLLYLIIIYKNKSLNLNLFLIYITIFHLIAFLTTSYYSNKIFKNKFFTFNNVIDAIYQNYIYLNTLIIRLKRVK